MDKVVYFEYCALIIEVIILASVYQRNMFKGLVNRWYVAIISCTTVATVTDIIGMSLETLGPGYVISKYIANLICLWSTSTVSFLLCGYMFAQTGIAFVVGNDRNKIRLFCAPMVINTFVLFIVNPFLKCYFYIDSNGIYARGQGILLLYILSLVYVCVGVFVTFKYRNIYTLRKLLSVLILLTSSVIATFIQLFFPNIIIQMFITACATLILLIEVQSPEERIHAGMGTLSMNAYANDVKHLFDVGAVFQVTLITMTNYKVLEGLVGYLHMSSIINQTAKRIYEIIDSMKIEADVYYLDGGRFAIIIGGRYKEREIELAKKVNSVISDEFVVDYNRAFVMANVCAVFCPEDVDEADFLIACDDVLAKESYSGELRFGSNMFSKRDYEFSRDFDRVIDRAFTEKYLNIHYQPIYDKKEKRYISAEAFIRFNDPDYGYIDPITLIHEAEKSHAIHAITTYVVEEVCRFLSQPDFLLLGLDFIEINLSPVQCMWGDLIVVLLSTIRSYNVSPKRICFNITDIDDYDLYLRIKNNIESLSQIGFGLVMDDFGAGIFEVERITELPLKAIKLDRDFIQKGLRKENESILKGTIRMINDMGINASAVGVENEEMDDKLEKLGCVAVQGYHYCKPVDRKELIKHILLA